MTNRPRGAEPQRFTEPEARLRALFDEHHDFVWRSARRLGIGLDDVDDVVQETFIVVGRRLAEFEGRSSLRTWLFGIVMRVAHTHRRSRDRRHRKAEALAQTAQEGFDPYAQTDAVDLLQRAIGSLDEERAVVFILTDLEGLTANEIAAELGVNINTIYSRIRAARKQVEDELTRIEAEKGGSAWNR